MEKPDIFTWQKTGHYYVGLTNLIRHMSPPRDNVLFVPRKNVRFFKNELRLSFQIFWKENLNARGHYCDEHTRG